MRFSRGSRKFLELENRQHNGWPCAPFGSPTRFHRRTPILLACSRWGVRVNLSNARWLGAPGELTRPYISGLSPAKSERAEMHQLLPQAKKHLLEKLLSTPESQRPCGKLHSRKHPGLPVVQSVEASVLAEDQCRKCCRLMARRASSADEVSSLCQTGERATKWMIEAGLNRATLNNSRNNPKRAAVPTRKHCPGRVHTCARQAHQVPEPRGHPLGRRRPHATKLRTDARAG